MNDGVGDPRSPDSAQKSHHNTDADEALQAVFGPGWGHFLQCLDLVGQYAVVVSRDAKVIFANRTLRDRLGGRYREVPTNKVGFAKFFRPLDDSGELLPLSLWPSACALRGESAHDIDIQLRISGEFHPVPFKFSFGPLRDAQGQVQGALITCEPNLSARRAMDLARKKQRLIDATVSSLQVGLLVEDVKGNIVLANPAAQKILGIPDREWPPKSRKYLAEKFSIHDAAGRELPMHEHPLSLALTGQTGVQEIQYADRSSPQKKRVTVSCSYAPIVDGSGKIHGGVVTAYDISQALEVRLQLQESQRTLRGLLAKEHLATELERQRIARELHDELQQQLGAIRLNLMEMSRQASQHPETVMALAELTASISDQALDSLRRIVRGLRPQMLDDLGLQSALDSMIQQFRRSTQLTVELEVLDPHELASRLSVEVSNNLYRVVQESLNNIRKHARASFVYVMLDLSQGDEVQLRVQDDGVGYENRSQKKERPLGILGMSERVAILGGTLNVGTVEGGGTLVDVRVPLQGVLIEPEATHTK